MPPARRSKRTVSSAAAHRSTKPYTRADRPTSPKPSASIARPASGRNSLRLTVKAPPSKLRQATSGSQIQDAAASPNSFRDTASESDATPQPPRQNLRSRRNMRVIVDPDTEEEEDEDEDEEMEDDGEPEEQDEEDAEGEELEEDTLANEDSEEDAEGEEDDMDEMAQSQHPPPPIIKQSTTGQGKPNVTVTAPQEGTLKSVEAKEMEDEDDELSELDSNENDEDDDEDDSDEDSMNGSRSVTPDMSKLTRRQRGFFEEPAAETSLLALSNEAQKKKHLTAEEHAMRRAEMARRRKNLSEKRNEEEKMDTINKLLKKPAPKRRTRAEMLAAHHADPTSTPGAEDFEEEKPDPLFVRWVNSRSGNTLGVPAEWLATPLGGVFKSGSEGRMIEEVA